jgi:hypothetical protein
MQKRFAVEQEKNDWVLAIDGDEVLTLELQREIISIFSNPLTDIHGFYIPISLVFLNRIIRFGGEFKKPHLRLFNKRFGNFNTNSVHEGVEIQGSIAACKNHVLHFSYRSIHHYFEKFNAYTTAAAQSLAMNKRTGAIAQSIVRFPLTFIKIYVLKGCFLDGFPGFVWSMLSSFYPVVKFIKLYELGLQQNQMHISQQSSGFLKQEQK